MLSTRLVWFEPTSPEQFPVQALAAVTTHDLPTIPGLWTGADLHAQRELHLEPDVAAVDAQRARLRDLTGGDDNAPVAEVVAATYRRLARAPSMLVTATLDDALGVTERPNQPGTVDEWPNWRLALPRPLEEITHDERVLDVARLLDEGRVNDANRTP
jgi:4-alpha-glucanotransferase